MGNCNCFQAKENTKKDKDILLDDIDNHYPNKKLSIKSQIIQEINQRPKSPQQRGVQNPTQNNIKKNQVKSRFDSGGIEVEEISNSLIDKDKIPGINDPKNINLNSKKEVTEKNNKTLTEILTIKEFDKEFHRRKDSINIVFLGERCVGKSSIVFQFMNNNFVPYYIQTMFKEMFKKVVSYQDKEINLHICVTSGVEQYQEDYTEIYRDCDFFVVCYDITSNDSFSKAKDIISKDLLPYVFLYNEKYSNVLLVGNKSDLREKVVDVKNVNEFTNKYKNIFFESSAKNNINISAIFNKVIEIYQEVIGI